MAKTKSEKQTGKTCKTGNGTDTRSKAQQAVGKTPKEERAETRNRLMLQLLAALLMVFVGLFLVLSMLGLQAAVLNLLRGFFQGLVGYGYWVLPAAFFVIAWLLVFRNHEPVRLRAFSLFMVVILFSALLHSIFCRIGFPGGLSLVGELWRSGVEGQSGGVIPGLIAQGLIYSIHRLGAIPLLLLLVVVFVFLAFRISAARMIHNKAEKRREKLAQQEMELELERPAPLTREDTMEDLRVIGATMPRPRLPEIRKKDPGSYDIAIGEETTRKQKKRGKAAVAEPEPEDDDLIFLRERKKMPEIKELRQPSPYDIPMGNWEEPRDDSGETDLFDAIPPEKLPPEEQEKEKEDVTELFALEQELPVPGPAKPEMLKEQELRQGAKEAVKSGKVTSSDASQAAAQVAKEIEAKTDDEAQETVPYQYPPMTMLTEALGSRDDNTEEMRTNVVRLEETLGSFGVDIKIQNVVRGPTVTRYEMELKLGVKMSKITGLHKEIALALGVSGIRVAPVPGKSSIIGIEVPNRTTTSVPIREVLSSREFKYHKSNLAFALGKDIGGNYIVGDIAKMPHMLIAGTTGSGKSVCMNSIIVSLLYGASPEQCRMIMIDPKVVELSVYNGIPHLLIPVVDDPKKAAGALQWAVTEMERRYRLLAEYKVRDMAGYNKLAASDPNISPMPQVVIIIDELADLMMVAAKEVENAIVRIAQKARAAGMHLVIATQRPSSDVITGLMKSNIPSRIAFAVASAIDSRIILDDNGAEKLVGKGDMLYAPIGGGEPKRVQGCFITDDEVEEVVRYVKASSEADYSDEILKEIEQNVSRDDKKDTTDGGQTALAMVGDELLPDAVEVVLDTKQASTSMLQRRLKLGYAHAARIMDEMEEKGIVGPFEGSKARQVLITREQWDTMVGINPRAVTAADSGDDDDVPFDEDE